MQFFCRHGASFNDAILIGRLACDRLRSHGDQSECVRDGT